MAKRKAKRNRKRDGKKCTILACVQKNDPKRFRERSVLPEKGRGRKERPRNNSYDDSFDCAA